LKLCPAPRKLLLMTFEFDPARSARTKADPNRGLDFVEAQQLWVDPDRLEIPLPFYAEPRLAVIGRIGSRTWTAIITRHGDAIRIISVRRSHPKEEALYEQD
jgi:uncharacterized DUF497 family protein